MPIKKLKNKNSKYNVSVEEAYKILTSKEKKYWMCNFKAVDPKTTGTTRKPRNTKPPKWFSDFAAKQEKFNNFVLDFIKKQEQFNNFVLDFIKKQEQFNNFVLDFIKKQEQFNKYVLDVFERNNLK